MRGSTSGVSKKNPLRGNPADFETMGNVTSDAIWEGDADRELKVNYGEGKEIETQRDVGKRSTGKLRMKSEDWNIPETKMKTRNLVI